MYQTGDHDGWEVEKQHRIAALHPLLPPMDIDIPMPPVKPLKDLADEIEHPIHYNSSEIQPIQVVEAWKLGYHLGNVVKYICRHNLKGNPIKDLKKAKWYLEREINRLEQNKE